MFSSQYVLRNEIQHYVVLSVRYEERATAHVDSTMWTLDTRQHGIALAMWRKILLSVLVVRTIDSECSGKMVLLPTIPNVLQYNLGYMVGKI